VPWKRQQQDLEKFPSLKRWFEAIRARPAVVKAYEISKSVNTQRVVDADAMKLLFGQTAETVKR